MLDSPNDVRTPERDRIAERRAATRRRILDAARAISDAMFGEAWSGYEATLEDLDNAVGQAGDVRAVLHLTSRQFFEFAVADQPRYLLMNERIGPSPEAYAPSVRVLERGRRRVMGLGTVTEADSTIWPAILGGLIDQHSRTTRVARG